MSCVCWFFKETELIKNFIAGILIVVCAIIVRASAGFFLPKLNRFKSNENNIKLHEELGRLEAVLTVAMGVWVIVSSFFGLFPFLVR